MYASIWEAGRRGGASGDEDVLVKLVSAPEGRGLRSFVPSMSKDNVVSFLLVAFFFAEKNNKKQQKNNNKESVVCL